MNFGLRVWIGRESAGSRQGVGRESAGSRQGVGREIVARQTANVLAPVLCRLFLSENGLSGDRLPDPKVCQYFFL